MFGGQSSGSLFGAPAASGSLFGAPSSGGLFGAPQSSASLFGGQPAASGGLFGAAPSAAAFGAPTASSAAAAGGLFGAPAASSGGLFGAPAASSGGLFGAPAASAANPLGTPAASGGLFGAPAGSGGLFGTPAASSASLFGSTPAASSASLFGSTPAASSASLFGSTPAASSGGLFGATPASSGGLFGATPASSGGLFGAAPASSGGLFGATPASSGGLFGTGGASSGGLFGASSGGGLFGASSAQVGLFGAQTSSPGLFGATATTAPAGQQVAVPSGHDLAHSQAEQAAIKRSLQELQELCTPGSANFKLTHLFLYVVDPAQKVRPPDIPQAQWEAALLRAGGANNRSGLWPVPVRGMQQLKAHHDAQQAALQGNRSCLAELQGLVQRLAQWDEAALRRRTQAIMDQHSFLSLRLLKVVRLVDALAVRIAGSAETRKMDLQLQEIGKHIAHVEAQLAPNKVQGLKYQVETVVAAAAAMDPSQRGTLSSAGVDQATMQKAAHLLAEHNRGLEALQQHLQRVERDVALVHNELNRQMLTFVVPTSYPRKAS